MFFRLLASAVTLVVCSTAVGQVPLASPAVSYSRDIQPILTQKCVACHACNDAACQLNLGSAEGATRGASKVPVYQGDRTTAVPPTRLFYDANGPDEWRRKGFYSVLDAQGAQASLMARMLELGHSAPVTPNAKLPANIVLGLNRQNVCATPGEFDAYAQNHPGQGMPLAVTGRSPGCRPLSIPPCRPGWLRVRRSTRMPSSRVRPKRRKLPSGKRCSTAQAQAKRW